MGAWDWPPSIQTIPIRTNVVLVLNLYIGIFLRVFEAWPEYYIQIYTYFTLTENLVHIILWFNVN